MVTGIILELSDIHGKNLPDCSVRVVSILIFILSTIVDGQVLAMLLEVILVYRMGIKKE